jgi:peptide/nickel transport system substrate-binding protein
MIMRSLKLATLVLSVVMMLGAWLAPPALAEDQPRYGGIMRVAIEGDPPSLDMHRETTFLVMIPMGNVYNTLIKFDPHHHDDIIGDLAESWSRTADGMTYTFKLRQGVKFHDGTDFTSADAKASWDKIVFPPADVVSARRNIYQMVKSIEASDPYTIVFHLHYPAASFIPLMALPYNFIYSKARLDQDMHWYQLNAMGTGPFMLKELRRGAFLEVERKKGCPTWTASSTT